MSAGILIWFYSLLLPSISEAGIVGARILTDGPWGLSLLRPQALFGIDLPPLVHGVVLSLAVNMACSHRLLARPPAAADRAGAGGRVRALVADADRAELPAAPRFGRASKT